MSLPTQAEYESREAQMLYAQIAATSKKSGAERKEAKADWLELLGQPERLQERAEWLLGGSYGYGSWKRAQAILAAKRGNRTAQLGLLLAPLECGCSPVAARQVFMAAPESVQNAATAALMNALLEVARVQAEEAAAQTVSAP